MNNMAIVEQKVGEYLKEVKIRPDHIEEAQRRADEIGKLKNSIEKGGGNIYGCLGEVVFAELMGIELNNTFDYDLIIGGLSVDVKSKHCTTPPRMEYECSVADFNTKQKCDYYVFVRVMKDLSKCWVLGKIKKEDYYKDAVFRKKGTIDPNSSPGKPFPFTADCWNLPINKLMPIIYPNKNDQT